MDRDDLDARSPVAVPAVVTPIGSAARPSFAASDAEGSPVRQCVPCAANADCANNGACATEADAGGVGRCAIGCTKEGFCLPGQVCKWVSDPLGATFRARFPQAGCSPN